MAAEDEDELMTDITPEDGEGGYQDITLESDPPFDHHNGHSRPSFEGTPEEYFRLIRDIAGPFIQSLELEREDLKKHLINVHGTKVLNYTRPRVSRTEGCDSKARWRAESKLTPHFRYTAWPEEPLLVPRRTGRSAISPQNMAALPTQTGFPGNPKLSEGLEQEILAEVQRQARETFYYRASTAHGRSLHGSTKQERGSSLEVHQLRTDPQSARLVETSPSSNNGSGVSDGSLEKCNDFLENTEASAATLDVRSLAKHSQKDTTFSINDDLHSSIMLDEDKTKTLARPVVRNIIQTTDKLLNGLFRMRKNHTPTGACEFSEESSSEDYQSSASSESTTSPSPSIISLSKSVDRHHSSFQKGIKPMDWSEMLGVASLLGFDDTVVARAHQRCETIFQESMCFHQANEEGHNRKDYETTEPPGPIGDAPLVSDRTDLQNEPAIGLPPDSLGLRRRFRCPEITCERSNNIFHSIELLSTHVQQSHGYLYELGPPRGKSDVPEWIVELKELRCPFQSCKNSLKDFPSNWRLMEHMKKKHRVEPRKISAKSRKTYTLRDG